MIVKSNTCTCQCDHPILCECDEDGTIICKLSDFDLVNIASDDQKTANTNWMAKLYPNPGGSRGMIAPEVFQVLYSIYVYKYAYIAIHTIYIYLDIIHNI